VSDPVVSIILLGDPVAKGRPRFRIVQPRGRPQFVTVYTDSITAAYERALAAVAVLAMAGRKPLGVALSVTVDAFVPIPGSWSNKKRAAAAAGEIHAITRPDGDNYLKIALDGCNGIVWTDDSIIVAKQVFKRYAESPRLEISVWEFDDIGDAEPELL